MGVLTSRILWTKLSGSFGSGKMAIIYLLFSFCASLAKNYE